MHLDLSWWQMCTDITVQKEHCDSLKALKLFNYVIPKQKKETMNLLSGESIKCGLQTEKMSSAHSDLKRTTSIWFSLIKCALRSWAQVNVTVTKMSCNDLVLAGGHSKCNIVTEAISPGSNLPLSLVKSQICWSLSPVSCEWVSQPETIQNHLNFKVKWRSESF